MAKINIKLDKEFLAQLTGSISKSSFDGNKKLQNLFNLINNHKNDNTVDIKAEGTSDSKEKKYHIANKNFIEGNFEKTKKFTCVAISNNFQNGQRKFAV